MATNAVSLLTLTNLVLAELGREAVANVNDSAGALLIATRLPNFIDQALGKSNWVWSIRQRTDDTPLTSTPNDVFNYAYQLPADYGRMNDVYTRFPYQVIDGVICSDQIPITYYYNVNIAAFSDGDYSAFPPEFQDYVALFCASRMCKVLTQDVGLSNQLIAQAQRQLVACGQKNRMEQLIRTAAYNAYDRIALFS